jgi:WD40 repeat protein
VTSVTQNTGAEIDRDNPWPGLSTFTEETRGFFFGRDKETDELSRLVRRETLTVLFGQSGLGKSSLLQAGLFPLLRESDHLPLYLRLDHDASSPALAEQVKAALNAAITAAHADAPLLGPGETLWEYFHRKDVDIWSAKNRLLTPVLAFDQFEEMFTLGRADETRRERSRAFLSELADLVENRPPAALRERFDRGEADPARYNFDNPSCRVILSLREDFLPDLEGLKQELPALVHNRLRLKRLNGAQALEAVTRPAPHLLADGVGERIVEFVSGARGGSAERLLEMEVEPALLSVICRELNERRITLGQQKITADLVSGNRREILTNFYARSVADLPERMREFVEDHLLTKSGFRDNLALETALEFPGVTRPLIDTLVSRRLVRIEDRLGMQRVELTHDVLAEVIRASRDSRQQRLAVAVAARRTRRLRWAVAGLALVVVGLCIGAFFGIRAQRLSAAQASQTDFVLGSRLLDEEKVSEGLAYMVRAGRKDPMNRLIAPRLVSALASRNFVLPDRAALPLPSPALGGIFLQDGKSMLIQGEDDVVRLIDTAEWRVVREYSFPQKVRRGGVTIAANDATAFAVVLVDNAIIVCDTVSGKPRTPPILPPEKIHGREPVFALSADARWLAASTATNTGIWDAKTGELRATFRNTGFYRGFAISPDGHRIVINDGNVSRIFSVPDGAPIGRPIESGRTWLTKFSADGRRLILGNNLHGLVADGATGELIGAPIGTDGNSTYDAWLSPDGRRLIYTLVNRTANVIDIETGKPVYPALSHGGNVLDAAVVDEGRILFTNSVDGLFRLWDLETGKLLAQPTARQPQLTPAAVSSDGRTVVMFSAAGPAYRLQLGRGAAQPLAIPRTPEAVNFINLAAGNPARAVWLTHDEAKVIDLASGRETSGGYSFPERAINAGRSSFGSTLGPGEVVIVRTAGGWRAWTLGENRIANDVPLADFPPVLAAPPNTVDSVQQLLPYLSSSADGRADPRTLGIWDTKSGLLRTTIKTPGTLRISGTQISISPDGKRIACTTTDDSVVHIYEIETAKELLSLQLTGRAGLRTFRFSPDGTRIISGDDSGGIHIWDARSGALLKSTQRHRTTVNRIDYANDSRSYSTVSLDGSVQVWDLASHAPIGELLEQAGAAGRADFSPDNTRIATPDSSGSARMWDVATGLPLTDPMITGGDPVSVVAFTPDGRFVDVHGGANLPRQLVRYWSTPPTGGTRTPDWLLTLATICAGHRLTDQGKLVGATDEFAKIEEVQRALASASQTDSFAEWGRWILSDSATRPIAPGFTITPAEARTLALGIPKKPVTGAAPDAPGLQVR